MEFREFTAGPDDDGRRLQRVLKRILSAQNITTVNQLLRKGLIKLDGKKAYAYSEVKSGAVITIAAFLMEENDARQAAEKGPAFTGEIVLPPVIFRNDYLLVLNKPYNVPVQAGSPGETDLAHLIAADYRQHSTAPRSLSFVPGPLHRLDRLTTGVLVFSQNLAGAHWFSKAIASHTVRKTYIGIVNGLLRAPQHWQDDIVKNAGTNGSGFHTVHIAGRDDEDGARSALTEAMPLAAGTFEGTPVTLVQFDIATGRTHQIRAQSAQHGFPLFGDTAYGAPEFLSEQKLYLHASRLIIPQDNPVGLPAVLEAPISTNFEKMLNHSLIKWNGQLIV